MAPMLLHKNSVLYSLAKSSNSNLVYLTLKCLESCTSFDEDHKNSFSENEVPNHVKICSRLFMYYLTSPKQANFNNIHYYKVRTIMLL